MLLWPDETNTSPNSTSSSSAVAPDDEDREIVVGFVVAGWRVDGDVWVGEWVGVNAQIGEAGWRVMLERVCAASWGW